ncbi:tetratricopeptide repeat protein [Janthinobacterium psychrotolerans]|uniref:Glycosyltransferase family 9 (Heptosyltransferase) n=1 Tax=Janthinobacterium psychrotolerans TaxID=1747903 RepID=A0A1A7C6V5_9BURK|nr:tetratricopeptide repeat protein [Janthinobacterium psychrotolerans]OBV40048.1 Glycosyltransferase family 9 (heptosyltransferase) [Janthinobacterium psychrotolerans]
MISSDAISQSAATHARRGGELLAAGDAPGAEAAFQLALQADPDHVFALSNLAWMREQQGLLEDAEGYYLRALALVPDDIHLLQNLGALLMRLRRPVEAERIDRRVLALAPELPSAWSNLGALLAAVQRETEAERCHRHAIALDGNYANARYNLSYLLLRQGRLPEGWRMLEARPQPTAFGDYFHFPRWHGEPLARKSILICPEAGMGDMLMLCRYASVLRQQGAARISILCHAPLKTLLRTMADIDEVIAIGEAVAAESWDYWAPVLSLPGLCETTLDTIPSSAAYLHAQTPALHDWAGRLPPARLRVGLAWKGNAQFENDASRSLPSLDALAPLGAVEGIQFVSLQKGAGENETCAALTLAGGAALADMADTAALIANLDLVISVDTAVAHLAGALGKPCWLLLPDYLPDWRWFSGRLDTPWYASMRLFRQPAIGGWAPLIRHLAEELAHWRQQHR